MRVGLFGGTFDPIHFGHISMALELKEKMGLDEIWFIPSRIPPLRQNESLDYAHRQKMVALAMDGIEGCHLYELENHQGVPSYTIDGLKEILSKYPQHVFFLLVGEDALVRFLEWKEPLEIVRLVPLLVASRGPIALQDFGSVLEPAIRKGIVATRQMEISSTDIRERLKKKLYCGHLVPGKVLDYISVNQLYYKLGSSTCP